MSVLDQYVDSSNESFGNASHIFVLPNHEPDAENFTYDGVDQNNDHGFDSWIINLSYYTAPDIPSWVWICSSVILSMIGAFGIFSNLIVIIAYIKNKSLHDEFNLMLMNMIVAELILAIYGIPIDITSSVLHGWKMGRNMCYATGFLLTLSGMVSIQTLTALSLQRWWMIYRNVPDGPRCVDMLINTVSIRLDSYSVIGLTWAMALALALPPLLGWNHYAPESNGISCAPAWDSNDGSSYVIYILVLGFALPNVIITYTSISVLTYHKKVTLRYKGRIAELKSQREKRVGRMVFLMILAFNVSWTPYAIVCFLRLLNHNPIPAVWTVPGFILTKSSCCWNPVIYVFLNRQFRETILPSKLNAIISHLEKRYDHDNFGNSPKSEILIEAINPLFQLSDPFDESCDSRDDSRGEHEPQQLHKDSIFVGKCFEEHPKSQHSLNAQLNVGVKETNSIS